MHQTVIGLETQEAAREGGRRARRRHRLRRRRLATSPASPSPSSRDKLAGKKKKLRIVAVEPSACPTLTKGKYVYDFGDTVGLDAARQDVHARPHLHPRADARGRPALSRHGSAHLQALRRGRDRGPRRAADGDLRGGHPVRARGGHPPRAGGRACRARGHRRGAAVQAGGQAQDHRLQSLRPRLLRPLRLRGVPGGQARGLRVPRPRRSRRRCGTFRRSTASALFPAHSR